MGLRTRAIVLGVATYLVSPLGLALGLGEIKIKSHLNQPLEAEIQLLQTRELTAQEILVGLGSREDFIRVGVDRPFFLNDLKFTVDMASPNGPVIRVKSTRLVREPFLNFIVQTQWPSGKLLREYTVLLDLPVFSEKPARAVTAAKAQTQPARPAPVRQQPAQRSPVSSYDGDTYGPVSSTDTLWSIAERVRPDSGVSVQQTMLAIQRLNPNAFINNNINLLKKGAVLRLPSLGDITDFDPIQAKREVANQNNSIKTRLPKAQIDASRSQVDRGGALEQVQGRVKLSSTTDVAGSKSGSGGADGSQDTEALRSQLLNTQEELTSTQREKADLNARIQAMDEQVDTVERLLEIANSDLRKFELAIIEKNRLEEERLEQERNAVESATQITEEEELSETLDPLDVSEALDEARAQVLEQENNTDGEMLDDPSELMSDEGEIEVVDSEPTPVIEDVKAEPAPIAKKKSFMDIIMENLLYIGGGIVLLIAGVVYFLVTRNNTLKDEDFEFDEDFDETPDLSEGADNLGDIEPSDALAFTSEPDHLEPENELTLEGLGSQLLDDDPTADPLDVADNHIALGEYPEALVVLSGLEDSSVTQLKRLEVFAKQDNLDAFDKQYAQFELGATGEQVERAQDLRGLLSEAMLGAGGVAGLDQEAEPDASDLDTTLQFDSITEAELEEAASQTTPNNTQDDELSLESLEEELSLESLDASLDLDLGEDLEFNDDELVELGSQPTEESISEDLDFTALDLDGQITSPDNDLEAGDLSPSIEIDEPSLEAEPSPLALDLEDDSVEAPELDLDLEDFGESADDAGITASSLLEGHDDLDIEIRESSSIAEDDDELDLSNLSSGESDAENNLAHLELSLDEDLALDNDLSLDNDVSLDDSLSLDGELSLDDELSLGDDLNDTGHEDEPHAHAVLDDLADDDLALEDIEAGAALSLDDANDTDITEFDSPALDVVDEVEPKIANVNDAIDESLDEELGDLEGDLEALSSSFKGDLADLDSDLADLDDLDDLADDRSLTVEPDALSAEPVSELTEEKPTAQIELPEFDADSDDDSEPSFLGDSDEVATKIDLLRVFVDMGDTESALNTLEEIREEGNDNQKQEAEALFAELG
ncbi:FimV/HubP family polar landmark protein [Marinagarivorans algicola]|uniref:FimV/HubP family polar landmark protein n=1 Tax=Marinagarivorans algicola TaxID=1513270 RepID=UPI0006B54086|nr:FimV/HubP family polar landmark protein [Marinagarivorans algicola]